VSKEIVVHVTLRRFQRDKLTGDVLE